MKKFFVPALLLTAVFSAEAVSPVSGRLFFAPNGTAPSGTHQLSAFKVGEGNKEKRFYALESKGAANTVSRRIYDAYEVDYRGYGPYITTWTERFANPEAAEGLRKEIPGELVTVNYQSRKHDDLVALVNNGHGYFKLFKAYDNEKVLNEQRELVKKALVGLGINPETLNEYGEFSWANRQECSAWDETQNYICKAWKEPEQSYPGDNLLRIHTPSVTDSDDAKRPEQTAFRVGQDFYISEDNNSDLSVEISVNTLVEFTVSQTEAYKVSVQVGKPEVTTSGKRADFRKVLAKIAKKYRAGSKLSTKAEYIKLLKEIDKRVQVLPEDQAGTEAAEDK
jgi:hypothetical protein